MQKEEREAFEGDGSLRDIYVLNTDADDWDSCISYVQSRYRTEFTADNEPLPFPEGIGEVFRLRDEKALTLRIDLNGVSINTHFFTEEEIEFDIDPREVDSSSAAEDVLSFMSDLGNLLSKEVVLTPENASTIPIYRFLPSMTVPEYLPPSGGFDFSS